MFGFHFGFYPQNPFAPTAVWNNIAPVQLPRPPPPAAKAAPAAAIEGATSAVPVPPPPGHRTAHVWHAQNTANPIFNITKKVHINTYSHHLINIEPVALQEVEDSRPAGLAPLMTVECMTWQAPPATMCERWSGVSPEIQGFMKGIETARNTMYVPCFSSRR
ncbi:hypothetical protein P280DRAFT_474553 [Massarina eburnea CBS 473.64]|uniref:Uncharacterized protein n=1 Tax=Massarina eburnea CBS 473.64 TaxID=1395130 RepID=A0A6A6RJB0_9PLEO|nr:hypothetical protein P280DRAFT_474553 [Massarina eburnea CBS 473.64]